MYSDTLCYPVRSDSLPANKNYFSAQSVSCRIFLFQTIPDIFEHYTPEHSKDLETDTAQVSPPSLFLKVSSRGIWRAMCMSTHRFLGRHKGVGKAPEKLSIQKGSDKDHPAI